MFKQLFIYHIKTTIRTKEVLFWCLLFPVLLGILFYFAFSNLLSGEAFKTIQVAVVLDDSQEATDFKNILDTLSITGAKKETDDDSILFHVTYTDKDKANELMDDEEVSGIITYDGDFSYEAASSKNYDETVTKTFLDQYQQNTKAITTLMTKTQGQANPHQILEALSAESLIKERSVTDAEPNTTVNYFYTLIAMACFFSSSAGIHLVNVLQANISPLAARQNVAPQSKLMLFVSKGLATLCIQYFLELLVLAFLIFILKIDFGTKIPLVLLTTFVGVLGGILIGTTCGLLVRGSEMTKDGIASGIVMLGCFLSGMMSSDIKYLISVKAPVVAKVNPVNLLTDAYYALYFYADTNRFWTNITILGIICALLLTITIIFVRRLNYDNI